MRIRRDRDIFFKIDNIKKDYLLEKDNLKKDEILNKFDNNNNEYHLEIGFGKGNFINEMSLKHKYINFIGIELVPEVIYKALKKIVEIDRNNLKLLHTNGCSVREIFSDKKVNRIYLNFSDPWPKSRHYKRRLTSYVFLNEYEHILKEDGEIHFKTDNRDLFEFSLNSFLENGWMLKNISLNYKSEENSFDVETEYEKKFKGLGNNIYRLEAFKINNKNTK